MLSKDSMEMLKQGNISKDAEKTKERVNAIWKPLSKEEKEKIYQVSGLKEMTVYRVRNSGTIQARLVVALSQTLSIDPLYITGQSDEQRPYSDSLVMDFLKGLGYTGLTMAAKEKKPKRKSNLSTDEKLISKEKKNKMPKFDSQDTAIESDVTETLPSTVPPDNTPADLPTLGNDILNDANKETLKNITKLTEDDCILLLKSQFIQATVDKDRDSRLTLIKYLLVK